MNFIAGDSRGRFAKESRRAHHYQWLRHRPRQRQRRRPEGSDEAVSKVVGGFGTYMDGVGCDADTVDANVDTPESVGLGQVELEVTWPLPPPTIIMFSLAFALEVGVVSI